MTRSSVYIETYGCQMNKLDSENVSAVLRGAGFTVVEDMREADVILLNTCGVRENAENRIHGRIGELSSLRKDRPDLIFGVIGCMAQRLGSDLLSNTVKVVAGPDSYRRLPDLIRVAGRRGAIDVGLDTAETYDGIEPERESPFSAWVAVTRGCDNFCSYCIVPYTRGRERSIPADRVIGENERLHAEGFREVTLLGQNVNSYRDDGVDFADLLDRAAGTGIGWVRFLTSHPRDLSRRVLEVMEMRENVCSHLHLPLQSGSDRVLAAMNRVIPRPGMLRRSKKPANSSRRSVLPRISFLVFPERRGKIIAIRFRSWSGCGSISPSSTVIPSGKGRPHARFPTPCRKRNASSVSNGPSNSRIRSPRNGTPNGSVRSTPSS